MNPNNNNLISNKWRQVSSYYLDS